MKLSLFPSRVIYIHDMGEGPGYGRTQNETKKEKKHEKKFPPCFSTQGDESIERSTQLK